ncbi:hypothetical protein SRHO_G00104170 [Serrasalmus rhombeus]
MKFRTPYEFNQHTKPGRAAQDECELPNQHWGVTYTPERVCALKGSSVDLSCTYKLPEGLTVTKSLWFIESLRQPGVEPEDVKETDQYEGRVQYSRTLNSCRMTITDLRESDAHTYRFRFYTDDPDGSFSGRGGVTLSVTDLKVTVSDTDGGVMKLNCSSTCTLPNNPTYIWYRNGQSVSECESASCPVAVVSVAVNYSCAVRGSDLRSPPVYPLLRLSPWPGEHRAANGSRIHCGIAAYSEPKSSRSTRGPREPLMKIQSLHIEHPGRQEKRQRPAQVHGRAANANDGPDVFPTPPELERAHRSPSFRTSQNISPPPFLVCFSKFQQKEAVIRWARNHELKY